MNIITVANQKGGVGKTTTTVSLGGILAQQGLRVLLIDMDPHGSMSMYFGYNPEKVEQNVYVLFQKKLQAKPLPLASMLSHTYIDNLDILPASTALITLDKQIGTKKGMGLVISNMLERYKKSYDVVLIDCPPTLGILMVNALAACQQLIIPVQTEFLAIKGMERMLSSLKMISISLRKKVDYLIIPTMFDAKEHPCVESLLFLRQQHRENTWSDYIPVDTKLREASRIGRPSSYLFPNSDGTLAYERLALYLDQKLSNLEQKILPDSVKMVS